VSSVAEQRIKPYLDVVLDVIAEERGCKADDLSVFIVRAVTDALLWSLYEGYDMAHDEPTVRTTKLLSAPPKGVWGKE